MGRIRPILFNTEMVRAILDGRKTVTRRAIKVPLYYPYFYKLHDNSDGALTGAKNKLFAGFYNEDQIFYIDGEKHIDAVYYRAPCQPGDILYVREKWCENPNYKEYYYAAERRDGVSAPYGLKWRPSIHMPKEAARIWLKVTDVRVERLQEINGQDVLKEGLNSHVHPKADYFDMNQREMFEKLWNTTIKKPDIDRYAWDSNPLVWVIEFERCEKPQNWR